MSDTIKFNIELDYGYDRDCAREEITKGCIVALVQQFEAEIKKAVLPAAQRIIDERATAIIDEALTTPFAKTNEYGEEKGGNTTLREMIVERSKNWFQQRVTERGHPDDRCGKTTRIDYLVSKAVNEVFDKAITTKLAEVKQKLNADVMVLLSKKLEG